MDEPLALQIEKRLEQENNGLLGRKKIAKEDFVAELIRRALSFPDEQPTVSGSTDDPLTGRRDGGTIPSVVVPTLGKEDAEWAAALLHLLRFGHAATSQNLKALGELVDAASLPANHRVSGGKTPADQVGEVDKLLDAEEAVGRGPAKTRKAGDRVGGRKGSTPGAAD
jgi:hypothetical protein